jgi:hypothetical protein
MVILVQMLAVSALVPAVHDKKVEIVLIAGFLTATKTEVVLFFFFIKQARVEMVN